MQVGGRAIEVVPWGGGVRGMSTGPTKSLTDVRVYRFSSFGQFYDGDGWGDAMSHVGMSMNSSERDYLI